MSRSVHTRVNGAAARSARTWRYVAGAFEVRIPVGRAQELLPAEESLLAVFKWKLQHLPTSNRWHPVLARYVDQIARRVTGMGGNPALVPPSLGGFHAPGEHRLPEPGHRHEATLEHTGKISGIVYDRFGDFEAFELDTGNRHQRRYRSHEPEMERLVKDAWRNRALVSVVSERDEPADPVAVVLRRLPVADC